MKMKHVEMHEYLRPHFTQEEYNFLCHMVDLYTNYGNEFEKFDQHPEFDPDKLPVPWELNDEKLLERWHQLGARKMKIEHKIVERIAKMHKLCEECDENKMKVERQTLATKEMLN